MTTITIIGWYGTETIGDRAILAGLINVFSKVYSEFSIRLGSLYPNFSKRVLIEDIDFHKEISEGLLKEINIFNSMDKKELRCNILESDLVAVGGGPLMDLTEMFMLRYAFRFAKRHGIKTALLGCGWGPLNQHEYIKCAVDLARISDIVIFRDEISREKCFSFVSESNALSAIDPAFFCAMFYKKTQNNSPTKDFISVNFRDVALDQYNADSVRCENIIQQIITHLITETDLPIKLVPMHTFCIGGDDRDILNRIAFNFDSLRINVLNNPPSLRDVMENYYNAALCIGMRFHAILLQTALNGNNYIVDYTNPISGKTIGLLRQLSLSHEYNSRYYSLITEGNELFSFSTPIERIEISAEQISKFREIYISELKRLNIQ